MLLFTRMLERGVWRREVLDGNRIDRVIQFLVFGGLVGFHALLAGFGGRCEIPGVGH